jgi:hypothetical protein
MNGIIVDLSAADDTVLTTAMQELELELDTVDGSVWELKMDSEAWTAVRTALEAHRVFGRGRHVFAGHHQLQLHPELMLSNIGKSVKKRGVQGTLDWLYKAHRTEKFLSRKYSVMVGVTVAEPVRFSNGVEMLPVEELRPSWHVDQVKAVYRGPRFLIERTPWHVTGMLRTVEEVFSPNVSEHRTEYAEFHEIALAATVASDEGAPVIELSWSEFDDLELEDAEIGKGHMPGRYEGRPPQFENVEIGSLEIEWIERYLALKGTTKAAMKTAASRLNMAKRRLDDGNKAIDLSTAFEAVLSRAGEQGEMTYKFRLRAALLLADTYEERMAISKQMAELYRVRGKIVHGDTDDAPDHSKRAIAEWGMKACGELLRKILLKGKLPDFARLELTGSSDEAFR